MRKKILVAYASKYGSTEEVAEAIAKTFRREGANAEVRPAYEAKSLEDYDAVVLGSSIYHGKPTAGALGFAKRFRRELAQMPTAFFVVCLTISRPSQESVRKLIKNIAPIVKRMRPRDLGLFAGKVDYADSNWFMRKMLKFMKIPEGDFRNWDVIKRWAKEVLPILTGEAKKTD